MAPTDAATPAAPAPTRPRAPPPPAPTPESAPEASPELSRGPSVSEPTKRKHRGFMRAIGGLFKRRSSEANAPSDSEASRISTSRWSRFSLRHSLPEAPTEVSAVAATPETAPIREDDTGSPVRSHPEDSSEEPPAKKIKAENPKKEIKAEQPKKEKSKPPSKKGKESPSEPSQLLESSDDEYGAELPRVSFLFFGGSEVESTFVPELRPSDLDDVHENDLRPSLQAKMPLFFSPPVVENLRRSSILPDPREYEF